ncbi:MAG: hypothetical protein ACLFQS_01425 [Bacteroidales bacterium]
MMQFRFKWSVNLFFLFLVAPIILVALEIKTNDESSNPEAPPMDNIIDPRHISSNDKTTAFRFRSDFNIPLNEVSGWSADVNISPSQTVDSPFRIRFEVETDTTLFRRQYSLQYRWNEGEWKYVEAQHFPYPSSASPTVSIIGCDAYFFGEEADNLLHVSRLPSHPGAGITMAPTTPGWIPTTRQGASAEWEWALVIRRWADESYMVNSGDKFAFRMVDHLGQPLSGLSPEFTVEVPEKHLGGTFVETPARIGPYENSNGELYFIMEPTETYDIFMMLKSIDGGKSWFEADPTNRPKIRDLEGVGSVMSEDGIIHIVHQISEGIYYHAFATSGNDQRKDRWIVESELLASHDKPPTQTADITLRPDGSLVAVYAFENQLQYRIREPNGKWTNASNLNHNDPAGFTNPSVVCLPDGSVDFVYKSLDGTGWYRKLLPDNSLTQAEPFAHNLGTSGEENIAILPPVFWQEKQSTVAIFRQSDGFLYLSYKQNGNSWSKPIRISDRTVVTNAVDSQQTGADVVVFNEQLIVSFIGEESRDIYIVSINDFKHIPKPTNIESGIDGSWLRGNILYNQSNSPSYGFIYDAGSKGGSGFNKFTSYPLE